MIDEADDRWPDLVLMIEPGRLIVKDYSDGEGRLLFYDLRDDALLAFTNGLLTLSSERSVNTQEPLYLAHYVPEVREIEPVAVILFALTRPPPMWVPLWRS